MSSAPPPGTTLSPLDELLAGGDVKACCAAVYEHPAVRWLLGDELHPGGEATTRRALELIGASAGERLLDVASGNGASAMLAAWDFGCLVAGIDYGALAVGDAQREAEAAGLTERVGFVVGDAEALPFSDGEFDAVLCECSLCTFPQKARAVGEMRRVLCSGGRLAISDVVVDRARLPNGLDGALATIACVGEALPTRGYEDLLADAGLRVVAVESRPDDAAALAERVHERLRGARLLGIEGIPRSPIDTDRAIELAGAARQAIADGALGYAIFAAER
ncbi:MAG: class I SAM-dependent methyltransferase [Solirubrobacterales bacterium]